MATHETIWVGAVAYDPKVVTIWEGLARYFRDEARLSVGVVLFQSYETQVAALLSPPAAPGPCIDIAWNTNLAFLQADAFSGHACHPLAMRDSDRGWMTRILALRGGPVTGLADLRGRTLALGSRDSGHAAILPVFFLEAAGLVAERDYQALRFDSDVGKHGDTGASEAEVLRAILDGRADAGCVGSPFWEQVRGQRLVPENALSEVWSSAPYNHCMFTARPGLGPEPRQRFAEALFAMNYENPVHRAVLEAEGLRSWLPPELEGYTALREAARQQGFFQR